MNFFLIRFLILCDHFHLFYLQFWEADAGKIVEDYESKGLPPCPGKMYVWECPKEMEEGLW